jgi:hypothetical protein
MLWGSWIAVSPFPDFSCKPLLPIPALVEILLI